MMVSGLRSSSRAAALLIKAWDINSYVLISLSVHKQEIAGTSLPAAKAWMVNSCSYQYGTTLNVPSMPQVFMATSSLMLPAVEKIRICFEALCVNKNAFPDFVLVNSSARTRS
ncbi:hypothetical protein T06_13984 [Trichinella sp. T6]|nr:hypothetical protein T06_6695 [Trichinella sp. T6]KRX82660.1 hypothetical protein T06_13984 [Trichinella sp. T6]